jgi:hypothetical protein
MQLRKYFAALFAALLLTGASVAKAAPTPIDVTWNPNAIPGVTAPTFTFDNVLLNTYATINLNPAGTAFTESGYMRLSVFFNDGNPTAIPTAGFPSGTPYSLYIHFDAAGTASGGIPSTGTFTSLSYQLLGAAGVTNFTDNNNDGIFEVSNPTATTLATGNLASPGNVSLTRDPGTGLLQPAAQVFATFVPNTAFSSFFVSPNALTPLDLTAAFTNTGTVVRELPGLGISGGSRLSLNGGGGNATFSSVSAIPEPDTYGMLLAGLGLFGFIARRKSNRFSA